MMYIDMVTNHEFQMSLKSNQIERSEDIFDQVVKSIEKNQITKK